MSKAVGEEIRRRRLAKGWGQTKLAAEAGMAVSGISQLENGKHNPTSATLEKVARALGTEIGDLFPKAQARLPLELGGQAGQVKESPRLGTPRLGMLDPVSVYEELLREVLRRVEAGESRDFVIGELAAHLEKAFRNASDAVATIAVEFDTSRRSWDAELRREMAQRINAGEDRTALVQEYGQAFEKILDDEVISEDTEWQAVLRGDA